MQGSMSRGVVYVALGTNAKCEYFESVATLDDLDHVVLDSLSGLEDPREPERSGWLKNLTIEQQAHLAKTRAYTWSPYELTLLLDADTRVRGTTYELSIGFRLLRSGWDIVMVPSMPPRPKDVFWHLTSDEQRYTFEELGYWSHVMLNTGVMFFKKNDRVKKLFGAWEVEWLKFKDRDQGAFLRALKNNPVGLFILGQAFNSREGKVVEHLFGRAV